MGIIELSKLNVVDVAEPVEIKQTLNTLGHVMVGLMVECVEGFYNSKGVLSPYGGAGYERGFKFRIDKIVYNDDDSGLHLAFPKGKSGVYFKALFKSGLSIEKIDIKFKRK